MKQNRPKNLDLTTIRLPLPAYASILHRISGFVLFIVVALMLAALHCSLESESGFESVKAALNAPVAKFVLWASLCALAYHFVAGIKHLVMDMGIGETKAGGHIGAALTLVISLILFGLVGAWVWA